MRRKDALSLVAGAFLSLATIYYCFYTGPTGAVPSNAPIDCPGLESDKAGKASACDGCPNRTVCASGEAQVESSNPTMEMISRNFRHVKHKITILSGKGGVGKSTLSVLLAKELARDSNIKVGILDIDICGPSIPTLFGIQAASVHPSAEGWQPIYVQDNLCLMSVGFLLGSQEDAVIWRGPKKNGLISQFLSEVLWRDLDYLLIDTPPGTSDEHLSLVTYLKDVGITGALLVTTSNELSLADVRREATFCEKTGIRIIGVIENMCNSPFDNFAVETPAAVLEMCTSHKTSVLARVPFGGEYCINGDAGSTEKHNEISDVATLIRSRFIC